MFIIYISGIDGCGKTTQAKLLVKFLEEIGFNVQYAWARWEPSLRKAFSLLKAVPQKRKENKRLSGRDVENIQHNTWLSTKRRILSFRAIRHLWLNYACADYYFTSRRHFRKLKSDLVVIDRYFPDFIIDQSFNLGIGPDGTECLTDNFFLKRFKPPNLNIYIDLPASVGYTRKCDGTPLDYLIDRDKRYRAIPSSDSTLHVNGLDDIEVVSNKISQWVLKKLRRSIA